MRLFLLSLLIFFQHLIALDPALFKDHPFDYDLKPTVIPGNASIMVCLHGYGNDHRHAERIKTAGVEETLVSFNFPDHHGRSQWRVPTFGSIQEILPALHVLKTCVVDGKAEKINLYGYSAGGGAVVNLMAALKTSKHDAELKKIGITAEEKKQIISALEKGVVILDTPLKSVEEIIDHRGSSLFLFCAAKRYQWNGFRPIDGLHHLDGLNIIVHFQDPDTVLSNRDDELYIEKLKKGNTRGKTEVVIGSDEGGHAALHPTLWKFYNLSK
jgi:hypothetical protein